VDLLFLIIINLVIFLIAFQLGMRHCLKRLHEVLDQFAESESSETISCRAEMQDDVVYLYAIDNGASEFLAQGKSAREIKNNLDLRFGKDRKVFRVVDGEESVKNILRQWAKEGQE